MIKGENKDIETLVLAPLAVLPDYQSNGIGKNLMNEAIEKSKKLGYKSIVVLGHENYYPKFGFKKQVTMELRLLSMFLMKLIWF